MKVLHVITGLSKKSGGPARSSQGLVAALCKEGVDAWIWTLDGSEPWIDGVRRLKSEGEIDNGGSPSCQTISTQTIKQFDLVHVHGIWHPGLHKVCVACRKAGVPYVVAPRGMLEPWSLKQKWLKKRIARWLYQDKDLKCAAALHATAESESEQFRKLGFKNPVIVSPNGVNVPEREEVRGKREGEIGKRALFVSRMHPKKGVLELVEAWAKIKQSDDQTIRHWVCELVYTVSGEMELEYEAKVKARVKELGLEDRFVFTGALDDDKKWEAYARADLFVLPTYSENFGIVVAEALWAGVPVITTKGTPWSDLLGASPDSNNPRCGWWIDLPERGSDPAEWKALQSALSEAFAKSNNPQSNDLTILQQMGRCGHELVEQKYTWSAVVKPVVKGYASLIPLS